jgi:hypothetical protein
VLPVATALATGIYFNPELLQKFGVPFSVPDANPGPDVPGNTVPPRQTIDTESQPEASDAGRSAPITPNASGTTAKPVQQASPPNSEEENGNSAPNETHPKTNPAKTDRNRRKNQDPPPENSRERNKPVSDHRVKRPTAVSSRAPSYPVKKAIDPRCQILLHKVKLGDEDSRETYLRDCTN